MNVSRQIRAKANALADSNDVLSLAEDIEVTHELQMELYEAIVEQLEAGTYKITISDYIRLVRLEQDLRGSFDRIFELEQAQEPNITFEWLKEDELRC